MAQALRGGYSACRALADKVHDSDALPAQIADMSGEAATPATRFDRRVEQVQGFLKRVASMRWMR
jgi:hypothetical protein